MPETGINSLLCFWLFALGNYHRKLWSQVKNVFFRDNFPFFFFLTKSSYQKQPIQALDRPGTLPAATLSPARDARLESINLCVALPAKAYSEWVFRNICNDSRQGSANCRPWARSAPQTVFVKYDWSPATSIHLRITCGRLVLQRQSGGV